MQNIVVALLTCSVTMSALALLYMAVTPLLAKRYSAKGRYYAWLVIVIGLVFPFRPQFNNAIVKMDIPSDTTMPVVQIGNGMPVTIPLTMPIDNTAFSPSTFDISWWQIAAVIWLVGMLVFIAYHALKHYRFLKMARRWSENVTDGQTLALIQSLKEEMGITRRIELYVCSCVGSPMMIGFVKPRILLPTAEILLDDIRFVLKHELVHHKRKDLLYKYLVLAATAIHWFNPVVYVMAKEIATLCEMSCDAEVVRSTDADIRQLYSEAIIGVVKYQSKLETALSTHFSGGKNGMKNRISSIMDTSTKKTGIAIVCMILAITLGTGFAVATNSHSAAADGKEDLGTAFGELEIIIKTPDIIKQQAKSFEMYKSYGLIYDKTMDTLFYNDELVRYFEDIYPVLEMGFGGVTHFDENGTVDVHSIRDVSQLTQNPDGSTDPSGKLLALEPYSQTEFDARDIDILLNPPPLVVSYESRPITIWQYVLTMLNPPVTFVSYESADMDSNNTQSLQSQSTGIINTVELTNTASEQNKEGSSGGTGTGYTSVQNGPIPTSDEYAEMYSIYEPFGITYDKNTSRLYYNGKLVRYHILK
jgi:beta-lactamase regulating signal transducer with metallopeptidase domain